MRNALAFLLGWLLAAVLLIPQARAAVTTTPMVGGYSSSAGRFASGASGFSMTPANDGYIAPSITNVGGRSVTMPANMRMASNAGQIAKDAMRLTPMGIAGTLAAGWLLDQGLEYLNDEWTALKTEVLTGEVECRESAGYTPHCGDPYWQTHIGRSFLPNSVEPSNCWLAHVEPTPPRERHLQCSAPAPKIPTPATPEDWDALPDPLPVVAPELPHAPYMPEGAPVMVPEYAPQTVPVGEPYTRADGSTAQPMARISPAGNGQVTIDTYDQPLTDPAGNPVADPQPEDTPEPTPSDCEASPNSLGCLDVGTPPAADPLPSSTVNVSFTPIDMPKNATCPAPEVLTLGGHSIPVSYDAACYYAEQMHPFVLIVATLAAAYIIFGVRRGGES